MSDDLNREDYMEPCVGTPGAWRTELNWVRQYQERYNCADRRKWVSLAADLELGGRDWKFDSIVLTDDGTLLYSVYKGELGNLLFIWNY